MSVADLPDRFWTKVVKGDSADDCWTWSGASSSRGYGRIAGGEGRVVRAHRVSWVIHFGPIPEGMWVLHRCDNPPCTNPRHLFLGTHADNVADRVAKGNGLKLTADKVRHARQLRSDGVTYPEIGRRLGISKGHARHVVVGFRDLWASA